jgi:hypothetical protein
VVDATSDEEKPNPRPVLDNDYEIRPCATDPHEDPVRNKKEAERDRQLDCIDGGVYATYALGCGDRQRGLLRSQRNASLSAMEAADGARHLENLPDRTRRILHKGDLIGRQDQRFRFQDSLG